MNYRKLLTLKQISEVSMISQEKIQAWVEAKLCPHYYLCEAGPLFSQTEFLDWVEVTQLQKIEGQPIPRIITVLCTPAMTFAVKVPDALKTIEGLCVYRYEANCSGIYFLCDGPTVVYVGQSKSILGRIAIHLTNPELERKFNGIYYLPCLPTELNRIEAEFIKLLNPKLNKAIPKALDEK